MMTRYRIALGRRGNKQNHGNFTISGKENEKVFLFAQNELLKALVYKIQH